MAAVRTSIVNGEFYGTLRCHVWLQKLGRLFPRWISLQKLQGGNSFRSKDLKSETKQALETLSPRLAFFGGENLHFHVSGGWGVSLVHGISSGVCLGTIQAAKKTRLGIWLLNTSIELLVGGLEHFLFSYILGIIIPIDVYIFRRGWNHQPDCIHI